MTAARNPQPRFPASLFFPPSSLNLSSILFLYLFIYFLYPFSFSFCLFPSPLSPSPHMSFPLEDTRCTGSYLRITLRVVDCALNRKQKPAAKGNRFTKGGGKRGEGRRGGERERRKKPIANNQVNARAYPKIINRTFLIPPRNSMGYWSNFFQPTAHGLVCPPPPKRVHLVARFHKRAVTIAVNCVRNRSRRTIEHRYSTFVPLPLPPLRSEFLSARVHTRLMMKFIRIPRGFCLVRAKGIER